MERQALCSFKQLSDTVSTVKYAIHTSPNYFFFVPVISIMNMLVYNLYFYYEQDIINYHAVLVESTSSRKASA